MRKHGRAAALGGFRKALDLEGAVEQRVLLPGAIAVGSGAVKVYVSVDMEGISGVADPGDVTPGSPRYERGREFMHGDANAAVAGAFDAGAEAVLVNDAHWYMNNLQIEKLDRRVRLVSGHNKPRSMMFGIDGLYAAAFFVGYHAAAGAQAAVLNHTMSGRQLLNVYVNGEVAGETRLNAALAGHHGVPVALVTGDDAVCEEAKRLLGDVETVAVKEGIDKYTANLVAPEIAQQRIREAATNAAKRAGELKPYVVEPPVTLGVDWNSTTIAAACEMIPGTKLAGPREVEYTANEFPEALDVLEVMLYIASQIVERPDTYD